MLRLLLHFRAPALEQRIEQQQRRADGDGGVRHIECREIRVVPVHVDEVDDVPELMRSMTLPIAPAENQRQRAGQQPLRARLQAAAATRRWQRRRRAPATAKNQRCQPPLPARKLNAAPVLYIERDIQHRQHARCRSYSSKWSTMSLLRELIEQRSTHQPSAATSASHSAQPLRLVHAYTPRSRRAR